MDTKDLYAPIRAFNAGWTAQETGVSVGRNPYNPRTEGALFKEWSDGWMAADRVQQLTQVIYDRKQNDSRNRKGR
jgi:hypothetical protein